MDRTFSAPKPYICWRDDLFYLAFLFLFLDSMLSVYLYFGDSAVGAANRASQVCYLLFLGVCVLSLLLRKNYTTMEILSIGGLLILGVLSYFLCDSHVFLDLTFMISISKNVDFEKFMRRLVITLAVFLFIVICLSCLGALNSVVKTRSDNDQMRNSLGFGHPNVLGLLVFELIAGVVVLERKRLKTVHLWLLLALGLIFYWISKSQTLLVGVCLLIGAVLVYKWLARKALTSRQMKIVLSIILLAALAAVVLVIYHYWSDPDSLSFATLAGRIRQAHRYLNAYGLSAFGKEILTGSDVALPGYEAGYSYLDNGEMWYLIRLGIVGCAVFFYTYIRMIIKSINQREFVLCIIAVVYLCYTLTENSAMRIPFNFMILYAGMMLYNGNVLKREMTLRRRAGGVQYAVLNKERN
ncbi:MAG: hypothetical protein LIO56_05680 [Lachnospiraceae bacterium]|nr:hypothetical protein [Lachnospiraceae bacterium]